LLIAGAAIAIPGALQSGSQHRGSAGALGGPTAYVATSAKAVVAINLKTNAVLKTIRLKAPGIPQDMAITANGKTVYVLSAPVPTPAAPVPGRGAVTAISTATDRAGRPIRLQGDLQQILITPNGQTAYVLEAGTGLAPIDLSTRRLLPEIKVRGAGGEAMLPSGKTIYVNASAGIVPVDLSTGKARKPIVSPESKDISFGPVITPNGATLYDETLIRASRHSPRVTWGLLPVNTATNTALKPITEKNFFGLQLAFGTGGTALYAASNNSLLPIDTATNKPLKEIRLPSSRDSYILAGSPDASTVYAADVTATGSKSWVVPINAATNTAGTPVSLGPSGWGPWIIGVAPDGGAYVGSYRGSPNGGPGTAGKVTVIPPGGGTVSKVIRIDGAPRQMVFAP
jgi:DNA-binding beta-propeller fold protein YncE